MISDRNSTWTASLTTVSTLLLLASIVVADVLPATAGASNSSLLWGTYRPNLYFGTRPRLPESVMTGLMWFDASDFQGFQRNYHDLA
jgi:mannosyl-oligosaccharide glucosidase